MGKLILNGVEYTGSHSESVSVTQIQSTGTKIATISVDNIDTDLYAPDGVSAINDLSDVNLSSPSNGQILKYNNSTNKWENSNEISYSDFSGSTHGLVPPVSIQAGKYLKDDGSWDTIPTIVDEKVKQSPSSTNADYEILFSGTADNTERTEGVKKSSSLKYNPNGNALKLLTSSSQRGIFTSANDYGSDLNVRTDTNNGVFMSTGSTHNLTVKSNTSTVPSIGVTQMTNGTSTLQSQLSIRSDDILLFPANTSTWDGTHNSLKDAIAAAVSGGSSIIVIEGTVNSGDTTVTLNKSYSEIKALIEGGDMPIITVTDLPFAGTNYYMLYNKYDGSTVNKQVNFIFSGTDCRYNSITSKLEIKNVSLALDETENNVARINNKSIDVDHIGYKELSGTLTAGGTSLTLTDSSITTNSLYDIYTSVYGVNPTDVTVTTGSITLTFEARQSNLEVKVRVN